MRVNKYQCHFLKESFAMEFSAIKHTMSFINTSRFKFQMLDNSFEFSG